MAYDSSAGLAGMLKAGSRHMADEDFSAAGVTLRNIAACGELARLLRTSLGPQGRCKLVVNHLEQISVTADSASILKQIEIEHPAANLLAGACRKQEEECGDGTNLVIAVGGELLYQTSLLIQKMTWQPAPEILAGYRRAMQLIEEDLLPGLVCDKVTDLTNREQLLKVLVPVLSSKQYGSAETLAPLVVDACLKVIKDGRLNVEQVRTCKILGASSSSLLIEGYVAQRGVESVVSSATDAKIAVYACGLEASSTEAKGTVLMKTADDLKSYNRSEERKMEEIIAGIAESGVKIVVTGGSVSDMALHFIDRYGLMCLKVSSKWELRRLCQATSSTALVRMGAPMPDEMGHVESAGEQEIGGKRVTVFRSVQSKLATIVLRASTMSVLNDLERAVDDGVQAIAAVGKDGQLVYGGGATEMALSVALQSVAEKTPGLEQYAMEAFAKSLQIVPRTLAENAGWDATKVVADLQAAHASTDGVCDVGIDIERDGGGDGTTSMLQAGVYDVLATKLSAIKLAIDAAVTILKIDQIIMSKPSGGPKPAQ